MAGGGDAKNPSCPAQIDSALALEERHFAPISSSVWSPKKPESDIFTDFFVLKIHSSLVVNILKCQPPEKISSLRRALSFPALSPGIPFVLSHSVSVVACSWHNVRLMICFAFSQSKKDSPKLSPIEGSAPNYLLIQCGAVVAKKPYF